MAWVVLYAATAVAVVFLVSQNGLYPSGWDTMFHVHRGELMYDYIGQGCWWPFFDPAWYNGVEPLRYWAPLPAYVMAACQALAGGSSMGGYLVFIGLVCFAGAVPWLVIGMRTHRMLLGGFIGWLWFFMPNNLFALFHEGNLPRALIMVLLPAIVYVVWRYLETVDWKKLPVITGVFALIALCHSGYAGMIAIGLLVYFIIYGIVHRCWLRQLSAAAALVLGYAVIGVWLVPSLVGGITSGDNSEVMATFFQDAIISLNPLDRIGTSGSSWYFGLAAFLLAVFGCVFARRQSLPGFWAAVVIFLCTTTSAYPILVVLPGSQYLWMLRFISIALCFILMSFLYWGSLRKVFTVLFCVLLVVDAAPSAYFFVYGNHDGEAPETRFEQLAQDALIAKAQEVTTQRLALLDEGTLGATGAYLVSCWGEGVNSSFGAGREAATTSPNIVMLNRALDVGSFYYLFDRAIELGNDSVLVSMSVFDATRFTTDELDAAARRLGYGLVDSNSGYRLYHLNGVPRTWGTVTEYAAIGIGSQASSMTLSFPCMDVADSANLNDFTFEDLSRYELVYLDGFTYSDKGEAEQLVRDLSDGGVRVVIAGDGIPEQPDTHDRSFLGVRCNTIAFSNGYPELDTIDGKLNLDLFPQGFTWWQTVYLEGLDDVWGSIEEEGATFDFYGTAYADNVVFVGLNLTYHLSLTQDKSAAELLAHAFDLSKRALPDREIVPLEVEYGPDAVTVTADDDDVNTTLARHDGFDAGDSQVRFHGNLTYIDRGKTVLALRYVYLWQGLALSAGGVVGLVLLCLAQAAAHRRRGVEDGKATR